MKEGVNKCLVSQWSRAHRNPNFPIPIAVSEGRNLVLTFSFRYDPLNPIFSFAALFSKLLLCSTSLFFTGGFPKHSLRLPSLKKGEIVFGWEHWGDPNLLHPICISGVNPMWIVFHHLFHGPSLTVQAEFPLSSQLCWIQFLDHSDAELFISTTEEPHEGLHTAQGHETKPEVLCPVCSQGFWSHSGSSTGH